MNMNFDQARFNMVEQQIRPWEVLDSRVLSLLETIHREDFVPVRYRKLAFADMDIPLACGQQMMRPKIEARMLQALELREEETVLEIGTGSGFVTACLASLAKHVVSVEVFEELHAGDGSLDGVVHCAARFTGLGGIGVGGEGGELGQRCAAGECRAQQSLEDSDRLLEGEVGASGFVDLGAFGGQLGAQ